jgi:phospholipase C
VASGALPARAASPDTATSTPIRHFIFLMQGDRTFDNYFGTYPGAYGLPDDACQAVDLNRPERGCVRPFSLHGAPPPALDPERSLVEAQLGDGAMNAFVAAYQAHGRDGAAAMGYYDDRDLPYYWNLANEYVLFDRFFASAPYGIRLNRSYWVAGRPTPGGGEQVPKTGYGDEPTVFDRLEAAGVSWKFYVEDYKPAETFRTLSTSDTTTTQPARVPLLNYARFLDDPKLRRHIVDLDEYHRDIVAGTLPAVAYVASSGSSERSARSIGSGQRLVRELVTQLQLSAYWRSSAFLWSYDGSGGWYDHVTPPKADGRQLGLRVPALLVSPYVARGRVDHTTLDATAALRFVTDNWNLEPLDTGAGSSLATAFDFAGPPREATVVGTERNRNAAPTVDARPIYGFYGGAVLLVVVTLVLAMLPSTSDAKRAKAAKGWQA